MIAVKEKITELIPQVSLGVPLENHTTFRIGGKAKYFFEAQNTKDIISALKVADKLQLPFYILGGGSKLLVSDQGFNGLIIKTKNDKFDFKGNTVYSEAGLSLEKLLKEVVKRSLKGLDWAAGIPGTVGGAVRGNAGAWNKAIGDAITEVKVFNNKTKKIQTFDNQDCRFTYRDSFFKQNPHLIILGCEMKFEKGDRKESQEKINEYLEYRKEHHPLDAPSAGSIFENPKGQEMEDGNPCNLPAGILVAKCGLAGKKIGGVKISEKHSNFIVNLGNGKAEEVRQLIDIARDKVEDKFGITLKEEIQYLGKF